MFDGDNSFFDLVPDIDGDGDRDLTDFLIVDDILNEEENEYESDGAQESFDDDWMDDVEDGTEYGIDPDDYEDAEDYEQALYDAKYGWRDDAENGADFGIDPENFETEEEYEEALVKAKDDLSGYKAPDFEYTDTVSSEKAYSPERPDLSERISASDKNANTSGVVYYKGIAQRRTEAKQNLDDFAKGEFWGRDSEIKYSRFIVESESTAAKYLTTEGDFLYAQAVKDHFKLPFTIPNETDRPETDFETLLIHLVKIDARYAFLIWDWCLREFQPYLEYTRDADDLTWQVLLDIDNYPDSFPELIVEHMINDRDFIERIILNSPQAPYQIDTFITIALEKRAITTAKVIMECAFANPAVSVDDKIDYISSCIDDISYCEGKEPMELFREHVFPIVYTQKDARIKCNIDSWTEEMNDLISEMEQSDVYSGKNEWRLKYKDETKATSMPDPLDYDNENDYLEKLNAVKYSWRKSVSSRYGVDPENYETHEEFSKAVERAAERARSEKSEQTLSDPTSTRVYKFCKVCLNYPHKPYVYCLSGDLDPAVGDRVIVPVGKDGEAECVVVSVGECYGMSLPQPVSKIMKLKRIRII